MDELLEKELRKPSLIKNPRVLDLKYIPKKLLHREEEQKMLIQYYKPVIEKPGEFSQRVSIIGSIGSGKTAMALKFGDMVKVYSTQKNLNLEYVHVNCRRARSAFLTLLEIVRKFNPHIPVRGFSPEEILKMLTEILNRKKLYLIVTLDEIDFVIRKDGPDLLYDLTRLTDDEMDMKERVSIIPLSSILTLDILIEHSYNFNDWKIRRNVNRIVEISKDQLLNGQLIDSLNDLKIVEIFSFDSKKQKMIRKIDLFNTPTLKIIRQKENLTREKFEEELDNYNSKLIYLVKNEVFDPIKVINYLSDAKIIGNKSIENSSRIQIK